MQRIQLPTDRITDWKSFHSVFAEVMGFPTFYGRNLDAWIDCMSDLTQTDRGMTKVQIQKGEALLLEIVSAGAFKKRLPEIFDALLECTIAVNRRFLEANEPPVISLVFL